ncbi:MAG: hypothetical protein ACLP59_30295 [Bryobacteraceae bacterium]
MPWILNGLPNERSASPAIAVLCHLEVPVADSDFGETGGLRKVEKAVRQSVSLPPRLAKQVGSLAKKSKLSKNRISHVVGTDQERNRSRGAKTAAIFALAERFRNEQDPEATNRLGDELGRMVFGG